MKKKILSVILSLALILCGCQSSDQKSIKTQIPAEQSNIVNKYDITPSLVPTVTPTAELHIEPTAQPTEKTVVDPLDSSKEDSIPRVVGLDDEVLLRYLSDDLLAEMESDFGSDRYKVESIETIYYPKDFIEALEYNSKKNVYFGYALEDIYQQFGDKKFVFTLGDGGKTVVKPFEDYDDTFDKIIKNVTIGSGVILICVVVSVATAGAGATAVSMIFAASAKTGATMALQSAAIGGLASGIVKGIETGDFSEAVKAGALGASEGFKIGAISGAVIGGVNEAITIRNASSLDSSKVMFDGPRSFRESEKAAAMKYPGDEQVSFLNKKVVPHGTAESSRPDILRKINDTWEAIEVKNYDLVNDKYNLIRTLSNQVNQRVSNLPDGYLQRIVLDVHGRGYTTEFVDTIIQEIQTQINPFYYNIPVDIMW